MQTDYWQGHYMHWCYVTHYSDLTLWKIVVRTLTTLLISLHCLPSFVVIPSSTYWFTAGVEVVYFYLITLKHTPQSVGLLWTRDRPVTETSTWLDKHCTRDKHPCPPVGFEPTIPGSARPQTHDLDSAPPSYHSLCCFPSYKSRLSLAEMFISSLMPSQALFTPSLLFQFPKATKLLKI
jgi:hypothetical protein